MKQFNRPYVRNQDEVFTPLYVQGENYSFYYNSEFPVSEVTGSSFSLNLYKTDSTFVVELAELSRVFIAGDVGYNFYLDNFVFPNSVNDGYYVFRITNDSLGTCIFETNVIRVCSTCLQESSYIKFRHNDQLFGVRYDLLPDFYQKFRLPINQIDPIDIKSVREQYRESSNGRELRNSKSFRDIVIKLEMYWSNNEDYEALSAMLEHTEIYIQGNKIGCEMEQVKVESVNSASNQSKGTFTVIVDDYNLEDTLENYGEFILWGGNNSNVLNTFVQG